MKSTYLEELDALPPCICWLLCRKPRRGAGIPVTKKTLASNLGWTVARVSRVCRLWTWATITVKDADAFRLACGISRENERRQRYYLKTSFHRKRGFAHIRSSEKAKLLDNLRQEAK